MCKTKIRSFLTIFRFSLGLSPGAIPDNSWIGEYLNSYAIPTNDYFYECWLAGETHHFELPEGGFDLGLPWGSNVLGCGLVLDPENKLWIFFTLNGKLMGELEAGGIKD
jgi:hypothetical protein